MFLYSRRFVAALAVAAIIAATGIIARAAKTSIRTESDPKFSFAGLKTWAWHPDAAGEVRLAYSSSADPNKVHQAMYRLRRSLGVPPNSPFLVARRGHGYGVFPQTFEAQRDQSAGAVSR